MAARVGGSGTGNGWNTLPLGAGGLLTGLDFADDKRMIVRCDTHNAYIWETADGGTATYEDVNVATNRWRALLTYDSMRNAVSRGFDIGTSPTSAGLGVYDVCFAPSNSNRLMLVTFDLTTQKTSATKQGVYTSTDAGRSWRMVNDATNFPTFAQALPNENFTKKCAQNKIAIDPVNPDIMYVGMPYKSGNAFPIYRSTDGGTTWDGAWTSGVISDATVLPGTNCLTFDRNAGTVTAFGQTVSKRMMFGVNGVGMYETVDGGVTWALTTGGPSTFNAQDIDYDGRVYVTTLTSANPLFRYDPNGTAGGGTWKALHSGSRFPAIMKIAGLALCVDRRNGGQGKLWLQLGALHGYYSANAQNATMNSITWVGHTGTPAGSYAAAPNDLAWTGKSRLLQTSNVSMRLDANGVVWMCGTQGFWYANMPIYANGGTPTAVVLNSVGRGIEQTVSAAIVRPPSSPYVFAGNLDVGLYKKMPTSSAYPGVADWWETGEQVATRLDCTGVDFARSDPSFMVTRAQVANSTTSSGKYSAFASNYAAGGWIRYATMPDSLYDNVAHFINGGYILAFDPDHHLCIIGDTKAFVPCYTSNARSSSCSWSLCNDLPSEIWLASPELANYKLTHTFDADYVNIGTAYGYNPRNGDIWRSTNYGANWTQVGNKVLTNGTRPFLYAVPGFAGYFYLSAQFTSASGKIWKYVKGGTDASPIDIPLPRGIASVFRIALGAPKPGNSHPALYLIGWSGFNTQLSFWRSDLGDGSDWVSFGGVPQIALPPLTQLNAPRVFAGDWVEYGRVYLGSWGSGFSSFSL